MGFLTNVSISNDFWHEITKNPQRFVDAIQTGMNYGVDSPLTKTLDAREGHENRRRHHYEIEREIPQGVIVHQARHFDEPQVIVNTYGSNAIAAHEIPYAISPMFGGPGWLELNAYNEQHAEAVARELETLAKQIREAVKKAKKKNV